jgi:hypothetical protein
MVECSFVRWQLGLLYVAQNQPTNRLSEPSERVLCTTLIV